MERAVHRGQAEINVNYRASTRNGSDKQAEVHPVAGEKLIRGVAVGFGLLCVLQAVVNVSLRLVLYTQTSGLQTVCKNVTIDEYFQQGWVYFHSSFYYISSTQQSWYESREYCQQQGADLVIINTKEEQDFMRQFHRLTWIGLKNSATTHQWTWVNGTPMNKSYWNHGEPNNYQGKNEDCVEIKFHDRENNWNDQSCGNHNFWICEKNVPLFII